MIFYLSGPAVISYVVYSFCRPAISAIHILGSIR